MTRLDSSARDYAIALVAVRRLHGFSDALKRIDLRLARATEDAGRDVCCEGATTTHEAARLVRARVALYLRLLRRVEAWEAEGCLWSGWAAPGWVFTRKGVPRSEPARMQWTPWRPLWTSAPPHAPGVTARMRREVPGPEVV